MLLAGVETDTETVTLLVVLLRAEYYFKAAGTLQLALARGLTEVALTIRERTAVLDVLDDPIDELSALRRTLLAEQDWRQRIGLTAPAG